MSPPKDLSVALHIGAHKTATSHLQRSLRVKSDVLANAGVRYYGPDHLRLPGRSLPFLFGLKMRKRLGPPRRNRSDQLALLAKDAHRLVISEENFAGVLQNRKGFLGKSRHPEVASRVSELAEAMGQEGIDVFLSTRNPAGYLTAAYSQLLLSGHIITMDEYRAQNPLELINWDNLVARLRAAKRVRQLYVWRYEDYEPLFPQICTAMVGADAARLVTPHPKRIHPSLSEKAVADVIRRHAAGDKGPLANEARMQFPVDTDNPRFDGFSAKGHKVAIAQYDTQWARIAAMKGVTCLGPS